MLNSPTRARSQCCTDGLQSLSHATDAMLHGANDASETIADLATEMLECVE